jgi:hypothetical protein
MKLEEVNPWPGLIDIALPREKWLVGSYGGGVCRLLLSMLGLDEVFV